MVSKRVTKTKDMGKDMGKVKSNTEKTKNAKPQKLSNEVKANIDRFPSDLLRFSKKRPAQLSSSDSLTSLHPGSVYIARRFFSKKECHDWVHYIENVCGGFEYTSQKATREYAHRECGRFQRNDWEMSELLFQRMKPLVLQLHEFVKQNISSKYLGPKTCNGNLRLYKYERGMSFGKHYDSSDSTPHGDTAVTVLIYLSSCRGGATRFYPPKGVEGSKEGIGFVPEEGAILMHMHGPLCLQHEADPVLEGIKYVLRTDIVYANK